MYNWYFGFDDVLHTYSSLLVELQMMVMLKKYIYILENIRCYIYGIRAVRFYSDCGSIMTLVIDERVVQSFPVIYFVYDALGLSLINSMWV
jgi:hypothetical protein